MSLSKILFILLITLTCVTSMRHISTENLHKSSENSQQQHSDEEIDYDGSESDESGLGTFVDDKVKDYYRQQRQNYSRVGENDEISPQTPHLTTSTNSPLGQQSKCAGSCEDRPKLEVAALDSIKKHLLMKLGMNRAPNVTNVIKLPTTMLENLCISNKMPIEYCTGKPSVKHIEYQSDEPANYPDFGIEDVVEEEEDVQYMSIENRIYAYPSKAAKYRHKSHLVFSFGESQASNNMVVHASLNIFVHSRKFLLNNVRDAASLKFINIEIAEILSSEKHKLTFRDFNVSIPEHGEGQYVPLNITELVAKWWLNTHHDMSHGIALKITSTSDGSKIPNKIVVSDADDMLKSPFIDIIPRDQRKKRSKRSSLKCTRDSTETRCCRRSLTVDFEKFGWDWIIAPKRYDANYCAGECKIAFLQKYAHTHVVQMSTASNPCCSPRRMSPMQLLYFDNNLNIVLGTIPNMIVDECFCS